MEKVLQAEARVEAASELEPAVIDVIWHASARSERSRETECSTLRITRFSYSHTQIISIDLLGNHFAKISVQPRMCAELRLMAI